MAAPLSFWIVHIAYRPFVPCAPLCLLFTFFRIFTYVCYIFAYTVLCGFDTQPHIATYEKNLYFFFTPGVFIRASEFNPSCSDALALNQWTVYVVLTPSPWRYMLSGSDVFEPRSGSI